MACRHGRRRARPVANPRVVPSTSPGCAEAPRSTRGIRSRGGGVVRDARDRRSSRGRRPIRRRISRQLTHVGSSRSHSILSRRTTRAAINRIAASSSRGCRQLRGCRGRRHGVRRQGEEAGASSSASTTPSSPARVRRRTRTCSSDSASRRTRCAPASDPFGIRTVPRRIPPHRPRPRRCDGPRRG